MRLNKIKEGIVKEWEKGSFFWTEIKMKNGDVVYLQNTFYSTGDHLDTAEINVQVNGKWTLEKVRLDDVAQFINENY